MWRKEIRNQKAGNEMTGQKANQLTLVLFWRCEFAEQKWITWSKLPFELLNTKYGKVVMEEFTNDKTWKSDLVCQKNISPNDICGSSSGNFASRNGKSFVLKMMT